MCAVGTICEKYKKQKAMEKCKLAKNVSWLSWLGYSKGFGLAEPVVLDISVMKITFGLSINISIAMIIGVIISLVIYKLCKIR